MKPISKELQAYFPKAADPARPWWNIGAFSNGLPTLPEWRRSGDAAFWSNPTPADRAVIDKTDPLPPPPILVGQVWASSLSGGRWRVSVIAGVVHESDGTLTITFANDRFEPGSWLYSHSILLACPYGYAPWSGPEVP